MYMYLWLVFKVKIFDSLKYVFKNTAYSVFTKMLESS